MGSTIVTRMIDGERVVGFELDTDDGPQDVRDGVAEDKQRDLTPAEHCDLFVSLCERLVKMGATEVRAEKFRAVFAQPTHGYPSGNGDGL